MACTRSANPWHVPCRGRISWDGRISPKPGCQQWPDEDQVSSSRPDAGRIRLHLDNEAKSPSRIGRGPVTPTAGRCPPHLDKAARRLKKIIKI